MPPNPFALSFVACQPRSGSTLLQRILGSHPEVYTTSEPWLMLPPAYTLSEKCLDAEYDAVRARRAIRNFWRDLPNEKSDYIEGLRRMYGFLYQQALTGTNARIFLDKTPRYYFILSELKEIFPNARFILLVRNPLAVLSSILRTWVDEQCLSLANFRGDLFKAPRLLLQARAELGSNAIVIHYEDLVQDSKNEMKKVCNHINIEFTSGILEYGQKDMSEWAFGDPKSVYEHSRPQRTSLQKWKRIDDAQEWRLLYEYARYLGSSTFEKLGYDYMSCVKELESNRPASKKLRYTISLEWLTEKEKKDRKQWEFYVTRILYEVRRGGFTGVARYVLDWFYSQTKK